MATQTQTTEAVAVETKLKVKRAKKSWPTILTDAASRAVKVTATKKSDSAKVYVVLSTPMAGGKRKNEKGATSTFPSIDAAMAHKDKLVGEMKKRGWTEKPPVQRGFPSKPDAFDEAHLPVAMTAAPAKSSKKK